METVEYRVRPTLWSPEQHYVLAHDALLVHETPIRGGKPAGEPVTTRIPLSSITRLRLIFAPSRFESNRFECELIGRVDGKPIKRRIVSYHFRGLADLVDQGDRYVPLVRALCQRTAQHSPALRLLAGYTPLAYYLGLGLLLVLLAAFATFVVIEWEALWRLPRTPFRLFLLTGLLLFLLVIYRRNRPRALSPAALPDELLPKVKT